MNEDRTLERDGACGWLLSREPDGRREYELGEDERQVITILVCKLPENMLLRLVLQLRNQPLESAVGSFASRKLEVHEEPVLRDQKRSFPRLIAVDIRRSRP
jgi:hypothetical protein